MGVTQPHQRVFFVFNWRPENIDIEPLFLKDIDHFQNYSPMPPRKSLSILLKEILKPLALRHWTRPGVEYLSNFLYSEDPMGLRGIGAPPDEYEPEAELAFAYAFDLHEREELWNIPFQSYEDMRGTVLRDHLRRSFQVLFGTEVYISEDATNAFSEALHICAQSGEANGELNDTQ